jgi:hypothetical protein
VVWQGRAGDRSPYADLIREPITVLTDYEQNHEQGGDQNDVRRSVHVVQNAVDFIHVFLLGWCKTWEHCGVIRPKLK